LVILLDSSLYCVAVGMTSLICQSRVLEWKAAASPLLFTPSHTRNTGHSDRNAVEGGISLIQNTSYQLIFYTLHNPLCKTYDRKNKKYNFSKRFMQKNKKRIY